MTEMGCDHEKGYCREVYRLACNEALEPTPTDLIRELRDVLGLPNGARPESPQTVWRETLAHVRAQRTALEEVAQHCPCGARPESPRTHPHVTGCPVGLALAPQQDDIRDYRRSTRSRRAGPA